MKQIIRYFHEFVVKMRHSGTTTLLNAIAKTNDIYILVPTNEEKDLFDKGVAISFEDINNGSKLSMLTPKPIFLDNYTMIRLAEVMNIEISKLESEIKKRDQLITSINKLIFEHSKEYGLKWYY